MIHQRFIPISPILNKIQGFCLFESESYFNIQYSSDSSTVTDAIFQSESLLMGTLEALSELLKDDDVFEAIHALTPECRFLLYTSIQISFLHFHADVEQLPALPPKNFHLLLCAYFQEGYFSFKKYCLKHKLDMWNEILIYEASILLCVYLSDMIFFHFLHIFVSQDI